MSKELTRICWLVLAAMTAFACAGQTPPPQRRAKAPDRYIYVSDQGLPEQCFHDLGAVRLDIPYGDFAVDDDQSQTNQRVRAAALTQYPDTDAVINLHSEENDVGTYVVVSGEAIELENHTTMECAMRKAPKVADAAALVATGGVGGVVLGGLTTGAVGGAIAGAAVGGATTTAYGISHYQTQQEAERDALHEKLNAQKQQIAALIGERERLQQCQTDDLTYAQCMQAKPVIQTTAKTRSEDSPNPAATTASTFDLKRQIQEQQGYIKRLKSQVDALKFQLGD